ncbi:MAG: alpha/beta fold hydrolase [Alphaproteobacteria bacterium]
MERIELAWGGLEYRRIDGAQPTLVLLHEGLACAELWRDIPDELAERTGRAVLVYSRYGYGGSDPRPAPWPKSYMHDEAIEVLPALLAALDIDNYVLIGHSDGGSIALIHAGGTPATGLKGVVSLAAHVFTEPSGLASIAKAGEAYATGELRARLARYHGDVDGCFRGWHDTWMNPAFHDWNLEAYLPAIRVPVLVVQGRDDEYGTQAQVDAIAGGCPDAEALVLEDCGHIIHRDRREVLLAAITAFVDGLSAAG